MTVQESCFLCGSNSDITREHFVPKNLFPDPKPTNMLTAPCCRTCNKSYDLDDEAFRAFASCYVTRSAAGEKIWDEKVMGSTFKRSPKFKKQMADSISRVFVNAPDGNIEVPTLLFPVSRANKVLTKITKGMLYTYYPNIDYNKLYFNVSQIAPSFDTAAFIKKMKMKYDERGDGVFRFARMIVENVPSNGFWIYVVYDGLTFQVEHSMESTHLTNHFK